MRAPGTLSNVVRSQRVPAKAEILPEVLSYRFVSLCTPQDSFLSIRQSDTVADVVKIDHCKLDRSMNTNYGVATF